MICKKCGAETLQENAVYCGECGARLDGKVKCVSCGGFNDEGTKYCVYCGTRIDGKKVCSCGAEYEGNFCPVCGKGEASKNNAQPVPAPKKTMSEEQKQKLWNKIFGWASGGVALLGVLFALIFTFFIGLTASVSGDVSSASVNFPQTEEMTLFYYFGDAYKEIATAKEYFAGASMMYADQTIAAMTVTAILGTVISVLTIGGVVGFAIPAVISYVKYSVGKSEELVAKWSVYSMLTFLGGAAAIYALNAMGVTVVVDNSSVSSALASEVAVKMGIGYNSATLTGIVFVVICLALYAAARWVRRGKEWKGAALIKSTIFTVVGVVFTFVVYAIVKGAYVGASMVDGASSNEVTFNVALTYGMSFLMSLVSSLNERVAVAAESCVSAAFVCQLLETLFILAIIVCAVISISARVKNVDGENNSGLVWNIVIVALSVCVLVCGIIGQVQLQFIMEAQYKYEQTPVAQQTDVGISMVGAIVAIVFAMLNLAVSIVQTALCKTVPAQVETQQQEEA